MKFKKYTYKIDITSKGELVQTKIINIFAYREDVANYSIEDMFNDNFKRDLKNRLDLEVTKPKLIKIVKAKPPSEHL